MTEGQQLLRQYLDEVANMEMAGTALLSENAICQQSAVFAQLAIVSRLGGYVLDDANTSDHHLLVTNPPLRGSVFFLAHDGDSRVVFDGTATFLNAVRAACDHGIDASEMHPSHSPLAADQKALSFYVQELLLAGDATDLVVCLIPSMDLRDTELLRRLVRDEDFYLGEAVANAIAQRPSLALEPIAAACVAHVHPQVASAGMRAIKSIRKAFGP